MTESMSSILRAQSFLLSFLSLARVLFVLFLERQTLHFRSFPTIVTPTAVKFDVFIFRIAYLSLQVLLGELEPTGGDVVRASGARIALVNQHSADQLDLGLSPLEFMLEEFPAPSSKYRCRLNSREGKS